MPSYCACCFHQGHREDKCKIKHPELQSRNRPGALATSSQGLPHPNPSKEKESEKTGDGGVPVEAPVKVLVEVPVEALVLVETPVGSPPINPMDLLTTVEGGGSRTPGIGGKSASSDAAQVVVALGTSVVAQELEGSSHGVLGTEEDAQGVDVEGSGNRVLGAEVEGGLEGEGSDANLVSVSVHVVLPDDLIRQTQLGATNHLSIELL